MSKALIFDPLRTIKLVLFGLGYLHFLQHLEVRSHLYPLFLSCNQG